MYNLANQSNGPPPPSLSLFDIMTASDLSQNMLTGCYLPHMNKLSCVTQLCHVILFLQHTHRDIAYRSDTTVLVGYCAV